MKYKTSVTKIENGHESIRGHDLDDLARDHSFVETIYLLLRGKLPSESEARMLSALFVSAIDHGPGTASAQTARITASAKNSMHTSIAAGILAMGDRHGSAIEPAARLFAEHKDKKDLVELIADLKTKKVRIPGYGHPFLEEDHRAKTLFELAKELELSGVHIACSLRMHEELNKISSKKLTLNIDGAMAAVLMDMGFDPGMMKGLFIIARMPGLVAQVYEEQTNDVGIRRFPEDQIEYLS